MRNFPLQYKLVLSICFILITALIVLVNEPLSTLKLSVLLVVFGFLFALALSYHFINPIRELSKGVSAVMRGDYTYRIKSTRRDELGILINNFNAMIAGLEEREGIKSTFSSYMAPQVAQDILSDLDKSPSKFTEASMLFVDIVGYTSLCKYLEPKEVTDILNEYYAHIAKATDLYNGTLDKFLGDGALMVFGAPEYDGQHRFNAICCAQLLLKLSIELNQRRSNEGLPKVEFRLAIHTGEVFSGVVGCPERRDYTVAGDPVNSAAHLCSDSEPNKVVITDSVYQGEDITSRTFVSDPIERIIRGKNSATTTYEVLDVHPDHSRLINEYVQDML
jgi:adenylate cyclase